MFSHYLICIFSYNRPQLLQNLLYSIQQFYPDMGVAIFDDGSADNDVHKILAECKTAGTFVYSNQHDTGSSKHGGLYALMNIALEYAISKQYQYAYFVQDDMQFLWRDETFNRQLETAFDNVDCLVCNFNFLQKISKEEIDTYLIPMDKKGLYHFANHGVSDTGIIDLKKAQEINLHFPYLSESENGKHWYNIGYRVYWISTPHLAWIPWPATYRYKRVEERQTKFLYPLKQKAINNILNNNDYAYLEDYTRTKTFTIKPYWFAASPGTINLLKIYIKYYLRLLL